MRTLLIGICVAGLLLMGQAAQAALNVGDVAISPGVSLYSDWQNDQSGPATMVGIRFTGTPIKEKLLAGALDDNKGVATRTFDAVAYVALEYGRIYIVRPMSTDTATRVYVGPGVTVGQGMVSVELSLLWEPLDPRLLASGAAAAIHAEF